MVPSLLSSVDRDGLVLLISYVSQAAAMLVHPGRSVDSLPAATSINLKTMALMESELETVLVEREGYRNRVR